MPSVMMYLQLAVAGISLLCMQIIAGFAFDENSVILTTITRLNLTAGVFIGIMLCLMLGASIKNSLYLIPSRLQMKKTLERMNPAKTHAHHLKSLK